MAIEKRNKNNGPLWIGGGLLLLWLLNRNKKKFTPTQIKNALTEQRQNNAYEVILTETGGDDLFEKIINKDFILNKGLPNNRQNDITFYALPDSLKLSIGQFKNDWRFNRREIDGYRSVFDGYHINKGTYYIKFSFILCCYIPTSAFDVINVSDLKISNIKLTYKNIRSGFGKPLFFDYFIENDESLDFWAPRLDRKKEVNKTTDRFQNGITKQKLTFRDGINAFKCEFILPQKIWNADNESFYQILENGQKESSPADYDKLTFFDLWLLQFDLSCNFKQFDSTIPINETIRLTDGVQGNYNIVQDETTNKVLMITSNQDSMLMQMQNPTNDFKDFEPNITDNSNL